MATLIANANAAFTGAATFAVVATASSSLLDSEAQSATTTTAYVESQALTPGAVTIDGIAVKVANRVASPSGTISVRLAQAGATVAGTEVTINVSDIDARQAEQGWYLFKFAPVLLVAATAYTVSVKTSVNAEVTLYKDATAGNWSRMLRTTTAGTAAAGDNIHILGEWTAAATKTDRTVTMDQTATTDYGDNTAANPPQFTVGKGGTLTWGVTAATNYILKLSGRMAIYRGGVLNMGTTGSPIPRDSSHELQFDVAATDGDFGLIVYGTANFQGQSRTIAKAISQCLLNTDEAAAQTVLGVDTDTGWLNGDDVAIASTSRTDTQAEVRTLNAGAGASSITVSAGLTNAHSGTSPTQAEVILLSRNCRVLSTSSTLMAFVTIGIAATVDCDWTLFRYLGANTAGKRGVECLTTSAGSINFNHVALREFDFGGLMLTSNGADNFTFTNIVGYKVGATAGQCGVGHISGVGSVATAVTWTITDVTIISNNAGTGSGVRLAGTGGTVQRIRCSSIGGAGILIDTSSNETSPCGTLSDFNCHACGQAGLEITRMYQGRIDTMRLWRQNTTSTDGGLVLVRVGPLVLVGLEAFGNANNNVILDASYVPVGGPVVLRNALLAGDTTFSTATGILFPASSTTPVQLRLEGGSLGLASGIKVTHSSRDIDFDSTHKYVVLELINTPLLSATEFSNQSALRTNSVIRRQRVDGTTNVHQELYPALGQIDYETTVFHTAAPSEKLTPNSPAAPMRLPSRVRTKKALTGVAVTVGVWVRKSAAYTGSAPRLIIKANPAIGITDDIVGDTLSVAADTWEQLTYTTAVPTESGGVQYYIDCDGAAGVVYADDWS